MERTLYQQSIDDPAAFWAAEATRIDWHRPPTRILDASDPEMPRWFVGGETNLCHNAVDRHLATRAAQPALIHVCGASGTEARFSYRQLHDEVNAMAAVLRGRGVRRGDTVLLYMPVMPETVFAMLACARLGAIHVVVFAGFPARALAERIDDSRPKAIVTAQAGASQERDVGLLPLVDAALHLARHRPRTVLYVERGEGAPFPAPAFSPYGPERARVWGCRIACVWLDSAASSYILHTSGTTGQPKGVVRDTGGHAVALAASLHHQFALRAGDTLFSTADLGWVVGHSYGVYAPLIGGLTTVLYSGAPNRPASDMLWRIAARHRVNALLSAPTVMRVLRHSGWALSRRHDLSALRALFLAGEPLDAGSAAQLEAALGKPVVDHYWQTETGSPIVAGAAPGGVPLPRARARAGLPAAGFRLEVVDADSGERCAPGRRGVVALGAPLPPGCLKGLWGDAATGERLRARYWSAFPGCRRYSTADWGIADADGRVSLLGRCDDTLNVAGQRLGTREIEEVLRADPDIADVAVVGIADALRGQVPVAFIVREGAAERGGGGRGDGREGGDGGDAGPECDERVLAARLSARVVAALGKAARPRRLIFVDAFPRTRSGKVLRRLMQGQIGQGQIGQEQVPAPADAATCSAAASDADKGVRR
ncbi:AMP-binding protein [Robbsia sp. Bb-Pol-6]|uniref:AMP-binding protein n=1 Tax=Robbsia betulipollinis TaxID=2981849 RepID=A0ABT3ZSW5_9BURK|nr:AMP-binding protein [Robbsia betulipollinis]MCY0389638.1 AMP-binding protein [Robbsia betulipollinis]